MDDDSGQTVRIRRKPKVETDKRGHSVWADPVESAELELVNTIMLKKILESDDAHAKKRIEEASKGKDGVLARDVDSNRFEIIDDDDLQTAIDCASSTPPHARPADVVLQPLSELVDEEDKELSLVSTQMLRRILESDDPEANIDPGDDGDTGGGFDPYNSS